MPKGQAPGKPSAVRRAQTAANKAKKRIAIVDRPSKGQASGAVARIANAAGIIYNSVTGAKKKAKAAQDAADKLEARRTPPGRRTTVRKSGMVVRTQK